MGNESSTESFYGEYPTLEFPGARDTVPLCARCLTLLSHIASRYGSGQSHDGLSMPHSRSIREPPTHCVICTKMRVLFDAARNHVAFEPSIRHTAAAQWSLSWSLEVVDTQRYSEDVFGKHAKVLIMARHVKGYSWGIGGFKLYPSHGQDNEQSRKSPGDSPVIVSLHDQQSTVEAKAAKPDFSSTAGSGSMGLVNTWAHECSSTHPMCHQVYGSKGKSWYPDRLLRLSAAPNAGKDTVTIKARIVEKSDPLDFPLDKYDDNMKYLSLSHCWGPPPDPSAPLGGRAKDVLLQGKLADWKKSVPIDILPLTFQHAIRVCALLGFEHVWIDSLCIIQDSVQDWQTQSALMADVYKFAWLNITALSSLSDTDGFINDSRDTRVDFGFKVSLQGIIERQNSAPSETSMQCTLLDGQMSLLWNTSTDIPGTTSYNSPLFTRAWVFQERSLARRTLAFNERGVLWACDGFQRSEYPGGGSIFEPSLLRTTQKMTLDVAAAVTKSAQSPRTADTVRADAERLQQLVDNFDHRWSSSINTYTSCNLTKQTDKLIAFSAIAREYAASGLSMGKRYLAGFWEISLPFQLAWITVEGAKTPKRYFVGDEGYMAPSWSWASIAAPVQACPMFPKGEITALADVVEADVLLRTEFQFGPVDAGWLRVRGRLNAVRDIGKRSRSLYLTDKATGQDLWFSSDTVEGHDLSYWRKHIQQIVWMPLTLRLDGNTLSCKCLVLVEVGGVSAGRFVKSGDKVYRRLGSGNFGRLASMLSQDALLRGLGAFQERAFQRQDLLKDVFQRVEKLEEIVLI